MSYTQLLGILLIVGAAGNVPEWRLFNLNKESSLRGITAVDEEVCWVGGSNSTLARTANGGIDWQYFNLVEAPDYEYRDIEAFGPDTAIVMSAGEGERSKLFKTTDAGKTWKIVYENNDPNGFFNGIAFWNKSEGILTGDPVDGKLFILVTRDGGETWQRVVNIPAIEDNEYGFAASGSHITVNGNQAWIGTGGAVSRVFHSTDKGKTWNVVSTPMLQGTSSQGIFSMAFNSSGYGIAVGGDYTTEDSLGAKNMIITKDYGKTWHIDERSMAPYRSAVRFADDLILKTGPSGSEYSKDEGHSWHPIKGSGFHALSVTGGGVVWAAGSEGRIGKLIIDK